MGILSDDFFDSWSDWKVELYTAISAFSIEPSEERHDNVVRQLQAAPPEDVIKLNSCANRIRPMIAVCKSNRKRDAIAICGPADDPNMVMTWKCSTHTPKNMRSAWKLRKYSPSRSGLYINNSFGFWNTHEVYRIPDEVFKALVLQFKMI